MRNGLWIAACGVALLSPIIAGCQSETPAVRGDVNAQFFGPVSMRLHPIFTQVKDWTGDNKPDGVEALVELQDQFGDPTKATGYIIFELFDFNKYDPERRGERLARWEGHLESLDDQESRWNRTSRTYTFQLADEHISLTSSYVLTAEFQTSTGGRFFDRTILEGKLPENAAVLPPSSQPSSQPSLLPANEPHTPSSTPPVIAPNGAPNSTPAPIDLNRDQRSSQP